MSSAQPEPQPVGYRSPPVHTRFKPHQSGNPRGRPKGRKGTRTLLKEVMGKKVTVVTNGRRRRATVEETILTSWASAAMRDYRAAEKLMAYYARVVGVMDEEPPSTFSNDPDALIDMIDMCNKLLKLTTGKRRCDYPPPAPTGTSEWGAYARGELDLTQAAEPPGIDPDPPEAEVETEVTDAAEGEGAQTDADPPSEPTEAAEGVSKPANRPSAPPTAAETPTTGASPGDDDHDPFAEPSDLDDPYPDGS